MNKPKNSNTQPGRDLCQTPPYALDPLEGYLNPDWLLWEPASGEQGIVNALRGKHYIIYGTDILDGNDFFEISPTRHQQQAIVTNPPFSIKYPWFARCCELDLPFALLMPTDVLHSQKGQALIWKYNVEILLPDKRINYKMPNKGWGGQAQFHSSWFTRGLNVGNRIKRVVLDLSWEKQFKRKGQALEMA